MKVPPAHVVIRFAVDTKADLHGPRPPLPSSLHLRPFDICCIAALNLVAGERGATLSKTDRDRIRRLASGTLAATPADPDDLISLDSSVLLEMRKLQNDHMTDEEKALKSFTRKNLMKLLNWLEWRAADDKQLDSHYETGTIGKAIPRPPPHDLKRQVF